MLVTRHKKENLQSNSWTGGKTTELAIYPEGAGYKNLDFLFRISTATIETESSTFSHLPGVSRVLMLLDGTLEIQHKDRYKKTLCKFDCDHFSGEWETSSLGKAIDFNIMTRGKARAHAFGIHLEEKTNQEHMVVSDVTGVFLISGKIYCSWSSEKIEMRSGDMLLIQKQATEESFCLFASEAADLAFAQIFF